MRLNNGREVNKTFTTVESLEAWLAEVKEIVPTIKEI
jgi:hypothetical protein